MAFPNLISKYPPPQPNVHAFYPEHHTGHETDEVKNKLNIRNSNCLLSSLFLKIQLALTSGFGSGSSSFCYILSNLSLQFIKVGRHSFEVI